MIIFVSLANSAAAKATGPGNAAASFAPASLPEWILIGLVVVALGIGLMLVSLLTAVRDRFPEPSVKHDRFVEGLLKGVNKQTDRIRKEFAAALHVPPTLPNNAVAYIRHLRRMLRDTTAYIAHMRAYPMPEWPSPELAQAFADWAGVVDSMDAVLEDMFKEAIAAIERHSWVELFEQYKREEWNIRADIDKLPKLQAEIRKAAEPFQKKKKTATPPPPPPPPPEPVG